jgi:hypothetical protein
MNETHSRTAANNPAYRLVNGLGVAANVVSFVFYHNLPVFLGLKGVSFLCDAGSALINKRIHDRKAMRAMIQMCGFDILAAAVAAAGQSEAAVALSLMPTFSQGMNAAKGLRNDFVRA